MMELIKDLPEDTVGVLTRSKITHEDYENILIPAVEEKLKTHKKIKFLYQIDDFEGAELAAMWDDTCFGIKHWTDFSHLAIVTDIEAIKNMTAFFAWMIPAEVKVFGTAEKQQARSWLTGKKSEAA